MQQTAAYKARLNLREDAHPFKFELIKPVKYEQPLVMATPVPGAAHISEQQQHMIHEPMTYGFP